MGTVTWIRLETCDLADKKLVFGGEVGEAGDVDFVDDEENGFVSE